MFQWMHLKPSGERSARISIEPPSKRLPLEGYRTARLTGEVARVLGLETSIAAQACLAQHAIEPNYGIDDSKADIEDLSKHFPELKG